MSDPKRRHAVWRVAAAATMLTLMLAMVLPVAGCEKKKATVAVEPPPTVTVATVQASTVPVTMSQTGTLQAIRTVEIVPRVTGYLLERFFVEGARVQEGQVLYQIDPRPYEADVASLEGQLAGGRADLVFYEAEALRYTRLAEQGAASQEQAEQSTAQLNQTKASIESTLAQLADAELNLSFTRVQAPFDGVVQTTDINIGNLVNANATTLTTIVQLDPIYVVFNISRRQLFDIQAMQENGKAPADLVGHLPVTITLPDGKPYETQGTLDFLSSDIDPSTDTLMARAVVPNVFHKSGETVLVPGQYVPVTMHLGDLKGALVIPAKAIVEGQEGNTVYLLASDNTVRVQVVELGQRTGSTVVVTKGLSKGDRIVIDGMIKTSPGKKVNPKEADTADKKGGDASGGGAAGGGQSGSGKPGQS